jgi:hypothetical protein
MSLADNKRDIFNKIGAYTSLIEAGDAPEQTDLFSSINNKNDIVPFILDVLKTIVGTAAIKIAIGKLFTEVLDDVEPQIKTGLKKQFIQSNANAALPTSPYDFKNQGIKVPVKQIDVSGKFQVDPSSQSGSLLFGTGDSFDKAARDAILNAGNPVDYKNMTLIYDDSTDEMRVKPISSFSGNIGDFFSDYIDNTKLIDKTVIIGAVLNAMYGTLSKDQGKTVEQQYEEEKVNKILEDVLNDNDSFVIPPNEIAELQNRAENIVNGTLQYDMGCGLMPTELGLDDLVSVMSSISGSTDPSLIANKIEETIDKSTSGNTETQELTEENRETIKDGFFQKIITVFTKELLAAVTTAPQIRVLLGMSSALENNGTVLLSKASEDMKNFKTSIKCMSKEIMKIVAAFLFALAIGYLVKLLKPVVAKVLREKINQYVGTIKSLTGINKIM